MNISKGEKQFTIKECKNHWSVERKIGKLTVDIQVPKDICKTSDELKEYIEQEETF